MTAGAGRRFVFSATGTTGDALPFLAIAGELSRRGYECHLLGNALVETKAREQGVNFVRVAPPQLNNLAPPQESFERYHLASYAPSRQFFAGLDLSKPTLVANVSNLSPTGMLAEAYDLALCRLYLAPYHVQSLVAPPYPMKKTAASILGHTYVKYKLPKLYELWDTLPFTIGRINQFRRELGLEAVRRARHTERFVSRYLGLFPDWFANRAADWSDRLVTTGFPMTPARGHLPQSLDTFIERTGKPLVFTPGTGVTDVKAFFREATVCCRRLDRPGIFLSPHASTVVDPDPRIATSDYADLELLLPKSSLIVHHGGIGTAARAIEAEVPQIVSPVAYDQHDNAHRVAALGAGAILERSEFTGAALASLVTMLLRDQSMSGRLAALSHRLRKSSGITAAADELESCFEARGHEARTRNFANGSPVS